MKFKVILAAFFLFVTFFFAHTAPADAASPYVYGPDRYGISTGGGFQYLDAAERDRRLDDFKALGVRWVRFDFNWDDIQHSGRNSYNWTKYDGVVDAANARGIKILGMIAYTPPWARPNNCDTMFCPPKNLNDYSNFVSQTVTRYKSKNVHYWEIWNEPNLVRFWQPTPDAARYTQLLQGAYKAAKSANPESVIISGGLSPATDNGSNIAPRTFVTRMYDNGAQGDFDALGHHPYCFEGEEFNCPYQYAEWSAWSQMIDTNPSLRSIMTARGDGGKPIWATEFGAPTANNSRAVSESKQAQMVTDAYTLFRSYDWSGALFWFNYKDGSENFGLLRSDYTRKPSYDAYNQSSP
jgi:polysaccharide biosynthesis protein PslG